MKYRYRVLSILEKVFYKIMQKFKLYNSVESVAIDSIERVINGIPRKKILYLATKYDYNNKYRGISYEEYNFFYTLKNMKDIEIIRIDIYSIFKKYGKQIANEVIQEVAFLENVDTLLLLLYNDIFNYQMLKKLSDIYGIETILWLFDDDKRYPYTKELVKCFDKVVTTLKERHEQRKKEGVNSITAQFAANHYLYRELPVEKKYDVVFIGQNFENREEYLNYLLENGIDIKVFGKGWKNSSRVSQTQMIEIINQSKIVLNFSRSAGNPNLKYLKGRIFEVTATGSFLLTEICEGLEEYFEIGKDIDVFKNKIQLLEKVVFYLNNSDIREKMAHNAKEKVLNNYTVEKYLNFVLF